MEASPSIGTSFSLKKSTVLLMPSADISDGWETITTPSRLIGVQTMRKLQIQ